MNIFQKYAGYYDLIYRQKNYKKEADFLEQVIKKYSPLKVKNILSLGCGTAGHDIILARNGFKITGVDKSGKMIKLAEKKAKEDNLDIKFKLGDIRKLKFNEKFDFSMAMFNVIGYQTENKDMEGLLKGLSKSLKKNALFVFDCWYGPAVLKDRPFNKIKKITEGSKEIIRTTKQNLEVAKNIVNIEFEILEKEKEESKTHFKENHKMRFWYLPELEYFLEKAGFKLVKSCNFLDLNSKVSENKWDIFIIAKKK